MRTAPAAAGPARGPGPGHRRGSDRGRGDRGRAHGPATNATPITASELRTRLLAAIDTASSDILYSHTPGRPRSGGQYPAFPRPGQEVHIRVGPAVGSDGKVYKDGEYSFKMTSKTALRHYINNYTANLDQGGLHLSGTVMAVDHFNHTWRECHSKFILGFTLDGAGIRTEIAKGQFTIIGRTELQGQRAIELKINVPPNNEAPPHVTAERMWVNATSLPTDAGVHAHVQWTAERLGLRLPPADGRAPGEAAPGNPGGLHPGELLTRSPSRDRGAG